MAGTTPRDWQHHGGTLRTAEPLREGPRGRRGVQILLKNLRRTGAEPWMIRSVEESLRDGSSSNGRR
jgi:hypothetical protein